jgi:hypothetical protein
MQAEKLPESQDASRSSTVINNEPVDESDVQLHNFYEMHQTDTKHTTASLRSSTQHGNHGEQILLDLA